MQAPVIMGVDGCDEDEGEESKCPIVTNPNMALPTNGVIISVRPSPFGKISLPELKATLGITAPFASSPPLDMLRNHG